MTFYLFGLFRFAIFTGILHPVTHTDANGLPLGSEEDKSYQKMLLLDTGLLLRLLNMSLGDVSELTTQILTASASMRDKKLHFAIRCSMENFGKFDYVDACDNSEVRHVRICPIYAIAQMGQVKQGVEK